jgi:predicted dehydrogenase
MSTPIGVGVIGLGFMGRTHARAYQSAATSGLPCELRAVCDRADPTSQPATGNLATGADALDLSGVRAYREPEQLLADPSIDLVSICTYTDTHADLAIRALAAGKHVLVEKPVAVRAADVRGLAAAAAASDRLCMPAMCMRFWNGWDWLRDTIHARTYGAVKSAQFQRLGAGPSWGATFYRDFSRSGGALWDLHIHDSDFIHWCFGPPDSVTTAGSLHHLTTLYHYRRGPSHVTAEGAWDLQPSAGFRMRYLITFERATIEFDLSRGVALSTDRGSEPVPFDQTTAYEREIRYFIDAVARGDRSLRATMPDAVTVAELLEAEERSMRTGASVAIGQGVS